MAKVETGKSLNEIIKEQQQAIVAMGCDPSWHNFEKTYNWFRLKQKLSIIEQDTFRAEWIQIYNRKNKGAHRKPMSAHF